MNKILTPLFLILSGPSSLNPMTKEPYATTFPLITVNDMVSIQFKLLDYLGIDKVSTEDY